MRELCFAGVTDDWRTHWPAIRAVVSQWGGAQLSVEAPPLEALGDAAHVCGGAAPASLAELLRFLAALPTKNRDCYFLAQSEIVGVDDPDAVFFLALAAASTRYAIKRGDLGADNPRVTTYRILNNDIDVQAIVEDVTEGKKDIFESVLDSMSDAGALAAQAAAGNLSEAPAGPDWRVSELICACALSCNSGAGPGVAAFLTDAAPELAALRRDLAGRAELSLQLGPVEIFEAPDMLAHIAPDFGNDGVQRVCVHSWEANPAEDLARLIDGVEGDAGAVCWPALGLA